MSDEPDPGPGAPAPPATEPETPAPMKEPAPVVPAVIEEPPPREDEPEPAPPPPELKPGFLAERPEVEVELPARTLAAQSRRDFLLWGAGVVAAAAGAWWLLPVETRSRLLPRAAVDRLDTLAARVGLSRKNRKLALDRVLTFDDDVAEALYSSKRRVRTYAKSDVTPLRNNYNGYTPSSAYVASWALTVSGLASEETLRLGIGDLRARFPRMQEQVTRIVCVEGWSAVAWWAALRSAVNLDAHARPDPYYVSIDLETARHPQTLLATHLGGKLLPVAHGAPLRLLVPVKLGLKNIKAVTDIAYTREEPPDYWSERGYSKYDGL